MDETTTTIALGGGAGSAAAQAASAAVVALARAARSFVLYDPRNAVVRTLLGEYQAKVRAALDAHGDLALELRPEEILCRGEVVYRDADREKSLAWKLFRDGVRKVVVRTASDWDEHLRLLEIAALRSVGVRQAEDDTVTLLRKAGFRAIEVEAVEGFVPAEESPEPGLDEKAERAGRSQPPSGWDTPLARLPQPGPLEWRAVPDEVLLALRGSPDGATDLALSVAQDLLAEAGRAGWPAPQRDLLAFFAELRDALLADGQLASLRRLVDLLGSAGAADLRDEMLRSLGDARTLDLVLASVADDAAELPASLVPFVPLLGLDAVLDQLESSEATEGRRRLLARLVAARLPREAAVVLPRLSRLEPRLARELARTVVARAPERGTEVARALLAQRDEALRLEGLSALETAQGDPPLRPLCDLLRDPSEPIRVRAAEVLGRRGDESVLAALRASLEEGREVSPREAEALGRALADLAPIAAARLFAPWLAPRAGFLRGLSGQQRTQQWAAIAGTGALPGGEADAALHALAERSDGEVRKHCLATLARRRRATHVPARP
ncbi:MAG TPA: HEAT repeat domain-containing protein [Anaeromyxobacteraceae bacterium]|nr:HEAT repeat domain-containing protein [Anaeromyxobacteraceae bacterium]